MQHMRRSRLRSNRLALNDGDPSAAPPAQHVPPLLLGTLSEGATGVSYHSNGPSRSGSPPHVVPPSFPAVRTTDGPVPHAYESLEHSQPKGPSGAGSAVGESTQHATHQANSSSTVGSGQHPGSPPALVVLPPGVLAARSTSIH